MKQPRRIKPPRNYRRILGVIIILGSILLGGCASKSIASFTNATDSDLPRLEQAVIVDLAPENLAKFFADTAFAWNYSRVGAYFIPFKNDYAVYSIEEDGVELMADIEMQLENNGWGKNAAWEAMGDAMRSTWSKETRYVKFFVIPDLDQAMTEKLNLEYDIEVEDNTSLVFRWLRDDSQASPVDGTFFGVCEFPESPFTIACIKHIEYPLYIGQVRDGVEAISLGYGTIYEVSGDGLVHFPNVNLNNELADIYFDSFITIDDYDIDGLTTVETALGPMMVGLTEYKEIENSTSVRGVAVVEEETLILYSGILTKALDNNTQMEFHINALKSIKKLRE